MKNFLFIALLAITFQAAAQNNPCSLSNSIPKLREVFIFSEHRNHTMMELFGEQVPPQIINIIYIPGAERKKTIDELVLKGEIQSSIFIFPEANGVRRYCSTQEYAAFLRNESNPRTK